MFDASTQRMSSCPTDGWLATAHGNPSPLPPSQRTRQQNRRRRQILPPRRTTWTRPPALSQRKTFPMSGAGRTEGRSTAPGSATASHRRDGTHLWALLPPGLQRSCDPVSASSSGPTSSLMRIGTTGQTTGACSCLPPTSFPAPDP